MLLDLVLVLCTPFAPQAAPPQAVRTVALRPQQEARGKLNWFSGSFEDLLRAAAESKRIVFVDFYSRTNPYSRLLEKSTYTSAAVALELEDVLCFGVDADSKESKPLRKRFQIQSPPGLVFLDADGTLRDQLSGFFAPEQFLMHVRRIKENQGTFSDLRARIQKNAGDLDARWELASKLKAIGDLPGFEEQVAEIRDRDHEGRSLASRCMKLSDLATAAKATLELGPLYAFVASEKEASLLFEGWWSIWSLEGQAARLARDPEQAHVHELRYFAAARALWPLVPMDQHGQLGNNIAWSFYENRASATRSDLEFALGVARKAVEAAPDVPAVVDTLACCLFAVGQREPALAQVQRCIELDPQNSQWRERLAEFQKAR